MNKQKMRAEKPCRTPASELQTEPYGASYGQKPFWAGPLNVAMLCYVFAISRYVFAISRYLFAISRYVFAILRYFALFALFRAISRYFTLFHTIVCNF